MKRGIERCDVVVIEPGKYLSIRLTPDTELERNIALKWLPGTVFLDCLR